MPFTKKLVSIYKTYLFSYVEVVRSHSKVLIFSTIFNIKEVKHLILSNVIFYPCQYINETFKLLLIGAGLVAFRVTVGQFYLRVFEAPLSVSFQQ